MSKNSEILEIFTDGACSGNPGEAAIGVVISQNGKPVSSISRSIGKSTNNVAEYCALVYALQEALILKARGVKVHTDSELLYRQLEGTYKIKNDTLKFFYDMVKHLVRGFEVFEMKLVPREENKKADQLATSAIQKKQTQVIAPIFDIGEESPSSAG